MTLNDVLDAHPWLRHSSCLLPQDDFMYAFHWLATTPELDIRRSTYSLKHDCEHVYTTHVHDAAFVAAAIAHGYGVRHSPYAMYLTRDGIVRSPESAIPEFIRRLATIDEPFSGTARQLSEQLGAGPADYRVARRLIEQHKSWLKQHRIVAEFPERQTLSKHARVFTARRMRPR